MYLTPSNGAVWKSWPDFSSWNREELVDSRPDAESLRTRQHCYPARKMKVEERKFDQALTKMLRAKPEPHLNAPQRGPAFPRRKVRLRVCRRTAVRASEIPAGLPASARG